MSSPTLDSLGQITPYLLPMGSHRRQLLDQLLAEAPHSDPKVFVVGPIAWAEIMSQLASSSFTFGPILASGRPTSWSDHRFGIVMGADELDAEELEFAARPLEDFSTWRRVRATIAYGSGVPRPSGNAMDEEYW